MNGVKNIRHAAFVNLPGMGSVQQSRHKSSAFDIEFNREQMANYLGINRSVLSHELKKMEKEGILKVRKNHFELTDKE